MTLSEFIIANLEPILEEWEEHAKTIPSAAGQQRVALRDHAQQVLRSVAADMAKPQTDRQQQTKSGGGGPETSLDLAAEEHAVGRQSEGFTLMEMVSEYRALRASVIRLWTRDMGAADCETLYELTRFNEAIDQALTESTGRYSERLDRSREIFLGILGHDLRSPLGAVLSAAELLRETEDLSAAGQRATETIARSATRIADLTSDLLDVTRTRLGQSLPIDAVKSDLGTICEQAVEEARAHHPEREIVLRTSGDLQGSWDPGRLAQLLSNLVANAIRHGSSDRPITVTVVGGDDVELRVHNEGAPIPLSNQRRIFEMMVQAPDGPRDARRGAGLGLGLYIARHIVESHDGSIAVRSSEDEGTTFVVRLPRLHRDRPS